MVRHLRPALSLLIFMTLLLGVVYPAFVTGVASMLFARQAAGSLVYRGGRAVGSALIAQGFSRPEYFWSRPSATLPQPYDGMASGGSNLGPLNPALLARIDASMQAYPQSSADHRAVPVDLVTTSGSGLDPDISVAAAQYQVGRVAAARRLAPDKVQRLISQLAEEPLVGFIGEARVNVLALNLALDSQHE